MTYDDTPYLEATSSLPIAGLFRDFASAATLLRQARPELRLDLIPGNHHNDGAGATAGGAAAATILVEDFYQLLDRVEAHLQQTPDPSSSCSKLFIIEVEGLDGSGKTTLVKRLAETLPHAVATKTPSRRLSAIRPLWDHRGGPLARAFYTISNYVLEYEICHELLQEEEEEAIRPVDVVIIDRWYASTCAYTIASHQNAAASCLNHDHDHDLSTSLPNDILEWPHDLRLRPHLLLVLDIDQGVRQERVERRKATNHGGAAAPSRFNPWDDRLAKDAHLGNRILQLLTQVKGPHATHRLNANATVEQVVQEALTVIQPAVLPYSSSILKTTTGYSKRKARRRRHDETTRSSSKNATMEESSVV